MRQTKKFTLVFGVMVAVVPAVGPHATAAQGEVPLQPRGLAAGEDMKGPWWMQQTALTKDGKLDLKSKPWWPRAAKLKAGEEFVVDAQGPAAGRMVVRREKVGDPPKVSEAIVWIIDDDGDGSITSGGDTDSDCYVVDYGCNGVVDRMVDYIDDDGDQEADEMDIRYFVNGELRRMWVGVDVDDDGKMWKVTRYEYASNFFECDPYGNDMIYMNKFDPENGSWIPISECPFAFYDTDGDGFSEVVVRVSAVPIGYDTTVDPDYANDGARFEGPWRPDMRRMGIVNIRYSFDMDGLSGKEDPLHYDCGFNMIGALPYVFPGMEHFNAKRRPPQVTIVTPFKDLRNISDNYPAKETGFSWHEQYDDTVTLGYGPHKDLDYRWEGVFWIWERRFMGNTGGPCQKWNMRREWTDKPTDKRELYYSGVDRRIHLRGAKEGWIQIGHFGGQKALGEIRMFDTDGNGYFDRWEVYWGDGPVPVRVTTVRDEKTRPVAFEYPSMANFYAQEVLPEAIAANERLRAAMTKVRSFEPPPGLAAATASGTANVRRFAQDVVREMHYQDLRQYFTRKAHEVIRAAGQDDLRRTTRNRERTTANTDYAWRLITALAELDVAYGQGDFDKACAALDRIRQIESSVGNSSSGAQSQPVMKPS